VILAVIYFVLAGYWASIAVELALKKTVKGARVSILLIAVLVVGLILAIERV
jgi:hypothetical protein